MVAGDLLLPGSAFSSKETSERIPLAEVTRVLKNKKLG